jgi:REP element-mobilizing transposase RayT
MNKTAIPKPHSQDLRKGRISEAGRIYLITTMIHERQPFFQDWRCGRLVVKALMGESAQAQTLAFVVMPDHLHWLLQLGENTTLPTVVRHVKSVSAHHLNQALNRQGKVWQASYHDHALRRDEDVVGIARYVVANPLRKGLVTRLGDYPLWDAIWLPS